MEGGVGAFYAFRLRAEAGGMPKAADDNVDGVGCHTSCLSE
jgi:hypothetical protein